MPSFIAVHRRSNEALNDNLSDFIISLLKKDQTQALKILTTESTSVYATQKKGESTKEKIYELSNQAGMVLGRLYAHSNLNTDHQAVLTSDILPISKSKGQILSKRYWGQYILIIVTEDNTLQVYRDPSGLKTVYFMNCDSFIFFSSDIHYLYAIAKFYKKNLQHHWAYFASYLSYGSLHTSETPFEEIAELLPGTVFIKEKNKNVYTLPFWDPVCLVTKNKLENPIEQIVPVFEKQMSVLLKESPEISLQLSGGLDSSALYLMLNKQKDPSQKLNCINFLNAQIASSDESEYVEKLVNKQNHLLFHELNYSFYNSLHYKWNRPHAALLGLNHKKSLLEKINLNGIDLLNGHGGDQLFLENVESLFLSDYLLDKGFKGSWDILLKLCQVTRTPAISHGYFAIKAILKQLLKIKNKKTTPFAVEKATWFTDALLQLMSAEQYTPPFWDNVNRSTLRPGKIEHILNVYHASAACHFEFPGMTEVFPYLFQPIVELGLLIPSYASFNEQWSRLHYRKVISEAFNTESVWRSHKGECSGIFQRNLTDHFPRVEELCLEGKFSEQGFIDKDALKQHLHLISSGMIEEQWLIIQLLSLELWFEAWSS